MPTDYDYSLVYLISFILSIVILYQVIYSATATKKKLKYMEAQVKLLSQIALSSGVNIDKVAEILTEASGIKKQQK